MSQGWLQISARAARPALLEAALEASGALAVSVRGDGDQAPIESEPGNAPPWRQATVSGLFAADHQTQDQAEQLLASLNAALAPSCLDWQTELVEDRDWVRAWMDSYRPARFGKRLWVCPHHASVDDPEAIVLRLDPGLAFGTGGHATTALCLEWLDAHPPAGRTVLDYGCGSGVLALAAARLGASAVQAVDTDPQALTACRANAGSNGLEITVSDPENAEPADLVLANILAAPLLALAPRLAGLTRPGGQLILSGLLCAQGKSIEAAYGHAFEFESGAARDGWLRLDGCRMQ